MPSLHETQRAIWTSLVRCDDTEAVGYVIADALPAEERLSIYRNTFVGTLAKALRLSFPAVERLVGSEFFEAAAQIFAQEHPPVSAYLDEYGAGFPEFLESFAPVASLEYLPDVARLEWAVSRALHADDVEPLDLSHLAVVSEDDHNRVCFIPHPSVSVIKSDYPVDAVWRAVLTHDDAALAAIDLASGAVHLMVQRFVTGVDVTRTDENAWRFAASLFAGRSLGVALNTAGDADAPTLLAQHFADGRFVGFNLSDHTKQEARSR